MIVTVNQDNPQVRAIAQAVAILEKGGVIVYPTDTVYALGCDIGNKQAIDRIHRIKKIDHRKPLSFVFAEIAEISIYVRNVPDPAFKFMKKNLPGPYTIIFTAAKLVPRAAQTNQKTIGVRIPDDAIAHALVVALGRPILSASVNTREGEYLVEPRELEPGLRSQVDLVLDAGPRISDPSTVIDYRDGSPVVLRRGKGPVDW